MSPLGMSSRHGACGSYLDVPRSPNQSMNSFAPSPAPGLIDQCSEVNFESSSLCEGTGFLKACFSTGAALELLLRKLKGLHRTFAFPQSLSSFCTE